MSKYNIYGLISPKISSYTKKRAKQGYIDVVPDGEEVYVCIEGQILFSLTPWMYGQLFTFLPEVGKESFRYQNGEKGFTPLHVDTCREMLNTDNNEGYDIAEKLPLRLLSERYGKTVEIDAFRNFDGDVFIRHELMECFDPNFVMRAGEYKPVKLFRGEQIAIVMPMRVGDNLKKYLA